MSDELAERYFGVYLAEKSAQDGKTSRCEKLSGSIRYIQVLESRVSL